MNRKKIEVTRKYNETANKYDNRYKEIQTKKYSEVLSHSIIEKNHMVLDVGGGTGLLLDFLKSTKQNIICCDISFEMLIEGRKKHKSGSFICADSENLPLKEGSIDLVTSFSMLQNLKNSTRTLEQINSTLKIHEIFVLSVLDKNFNINNLQEELKNQNFEILKTWRLSIEDIAIIARKK